MLLGLSDRQGHVRERPAGARVLEHVYQTVMEGMFSDPIYGGNRNKAGWKMIGFPGVIAVHRENIEKYRDKKFPADPARHRGHELRGAATWQRN